MAGPTSKIDNLIVLSKYAKVATHFEALGSLLSCKIGLTKKFFKFRVMIDQSALSRILSM